MGEEGKKTNKKPLLIVIVCFIVIAILLGMVYSFYSEEETIDKNHEHTSLYLKYNGTIYNDVHRIDVIGEHFENVSLQEGTIVILGNIDGTQIIITNGTLLSEAKNNSFNRYPYRDISYFDMDSNDLLTAGDLITITIDPSYPGNYSVQLIQSNGKLLAILDFEIE